MKTSCKKSQQKIIVYRSYKYFNNESFREELLQLLQIEANGNNHDESFKNFTSSCNVILNNLNKHPPTSPPPPPPEKKKYVRSNQSPFMNKTLSKAIMQRFKLRNLFP